MTDKDLFETYRLLSGRKSLSIQEKERIIDVAVAKCSISRKKRFVDIIQKPFFIRVVLVSMFLSILVPFFYFKLYSDSKEGEYRFKGDGEKPFLSLTCVYNNKVRECTNGSTLVFKLRATKDRNYFSAFAKHGVSGTVLWYYPATENEKSLLVEKKRKNNILDIGIVLGDEHKPGAYEVFGVFSKRPYTREQLRSLFESDRFKKGDVLDLNENFIVKTSVQVK